MDVILYENGTTRSARCRWTLLESGMDFKSVTGPNLAKSDEVKVLHPLGKLPVVTIDGRPLFESAAICTFIADNAVNANLIAKPGSWARSQHDQWTSFVLTEMEAWLWNTYVKKFVIPSDERTDSDFEQNDLMFRRSALALNDILLRQDYIVDGRFTVTDIIVGWTVNWGRRRGLIDDMEGLQTYIKRIFKRPHCTFAK